MAVTAGFAAATLYLLWPLFADPARTVLDPFANGGPGWMGLCDMYLIMWAMSWDWHALTTAPLRLFDANIFYPAPSALASSEHMLGHLPIFGTVYGISGNPVLANQLNVLLAFTLCGASMYALLRHWGVGRVGALFGGFVYAFSPVRVYDIVHAHLLAGQYLPLALLFLDKTLLEARVAWAALFATFLALQMLCSYYLAYMTLTALLGYAVGVLWVRCGRLPGRGVVLTAAAGLLVAVVVGLLSIPYLHLRGRGIISDYQQAAFLHVAATDWWRNYLYPPLAIREWDWGLPLGMPAYVGLIPLSFVVVALIPSRRTPSTGWAVPAALGMAVACYLMGLGPEVEINGWNVPLPYKAALHLVPGFSSMRVPGRFALVFMAGFAALAGCGVGRVVRLMPAARWLGAPLLMLLAFGTAYEYDLFHYQYAVRQVEVGQAEPRIYRDLAAAPPGPVLEIPAGGLVGELLERATESEYMFHSISHWHPLLNGNSAYRPPSYEVLMYLARALPDPRALSLLIRAAGLRYVLVHQAKLRPLQRASWAQPPGLRLTSYTDSDLLFEVTSPEQPDLMAALLDFQARSTTILGNPLDPLPLTARHAVFSLAEPPPVWAMSRFTFDVAINITNLSDRVWPSLAPVGEHNVTLAYRWENGPGHVTLEDTNASRLPYDLRPGESVRGTINVHAPEPSGGLRLIIGLAQDGQWFADTLTPIPVNVVPLRPS